MKKTNVRQKGAPHRPSSATTPSGIIEIPRISSRREGDIPSHDSVVSAGRPWPFERPMRNVQILLSKARQGSTPKARGGGFMSSEQPRNDEASGRTQGDGMVSRRASHDQGHKTLSPADQVARLRTDQDHDEVVSADSPLSEGQTRFKATCLWARLRHFLASCWAGARLRALCQYRPGASTSEEHILP